MIPTLQQAQLGRSVVQQVAFATPLWDAATVVSPLQLQNSDTRLFLPTGNTGVARTARCTRALTSGKWYWEVAVVDVINGNGTTTGVGVASSAQSLSANLATGTSANSVGLWCSGNFYSNGALQVSGAVPYNDGDRLIFALDIGAGKFWLGKNGLWYNFGDPGAGTNASFTVSSATTYWPAASPWSSSAETVKLDIRGGADLIHSIPAGFTTYSA